MMNLEFVIATDWMFAAMYVVLFVIAICVIYRSAKIFFGHLMAKKLRKAYYVRGSDLTFSAKVQGFLFFDILAMGWIPTQWVIKQIEISNFTTFFIWSFFVVVTLFLFMIAGFVALTIRGRREMANADYYSRLLYKVYGPLEEDDEEEKTEKDNKNTK